MAAKVWRRRPVGVSLVVALGLILAACGAPEEAAVEDDFGPAPNSASATEETAPPDTSPAPGTPAAAAPSPFQRQNGTPAAAPAPQQQQAKKQRLAEGEVANCNFDGGRRVDLSGIPGVTCDEQAWGEDFVSRSLDAAAKFRDYRDAEAVGFRTTDDAFTGYEHFVKWEWIGDGDDFNPERPESLVYVPGKNGEKILAAFMYMLPYTGPIENVYRPGGNLMQYHAHDNLCYKRNPDGSWQLVGETDKNGNCPPGSTKPGDPAPMVHVWVINHRITQECGPFASIEGPAGGRVPPGEERLCIPEHGRAVKWY